MKLPKHSKLCSYELSHHDLWRTCDRKAKFNDKPFSHWQEQAQEWVIESLLRAASLCDHRSIIGALYQEHMLKLANSESKEIVEKVLKAGKTMEENFNQIMANMFGGVVGQGGE